MNIFGKITRKLLMKNKTRTLVTIVGIILSTAMITAVTTLIVSIQSYVINCVEYTAGPWQGFFFGANKTGTDELTGYEEMDSYGLIQHIGSYISDDATYLEIYGADDNMYSMVNFNVSVGARPQTTSEIMLPIILYKRGLYNVGDTLSVNVGQRQRADGVYLSAFDFYYEGEKLVNTAEKTYTVKGFYNDDSFLRTTTYSKAVTAYDSSLDKACCGIYYKAKEVGQIFDLFGKIDKADLTATLSTEELNNSLEFISHSMGTHTDLLTMYGVSSNSSVMAVLYSMAAVLIALIMLGSVSLINNAFSISVTERTKQFGLLSSIGATRKQIRCSVFSEAFMLSAVGIPLGLLSGVGGIGVTLLCLSDAFSSITNVDTPYKLELVLNVPSLIIAVVFSLLTIFISAWIPSRRAMKITAIEAIRQINDIKLGKRAARVSPVTKKLFGLEGTIASKHFKRNRRSYRATIISLTISIVLFVVASAFCDALSSSVNDVYDYSCDIIATIENTDIEKGFEVAGAGAALDGVTNSTIVATSTYFALEIPDKYKTADYAERFLDGETGKSVIWLAVLDDASFAEFAEENGCSAEAFSGENGLACIMRGDLMYRDYAANKFVNYTIVTDDISSLTISNENGTSAELSVLGTTDRSPSHMPQQTSLPVAYMPYSACVKNLDMPVFDYEFSSITLCAMAGAASDSVCDAMTLEYERMGANSSDFSVHLKNIYSNMVMVRNLILIINVFTYGFIVLISLISAANVFNTISTNLMLRRREFAMLRTVGMTNGGLNKMMNYECVLYGVKSSVYGIILSLIFVQLITMSVNNGVETAFIVPWAALGAALLSVFLVVFATMLFSMHKIKRDNPIEALRNENI